MTTQTGPRLVITGTCEGCCHLRTGNVVLACSHPQIRKEPTGVAIVSMKAKHESWDMRGNMRHDCPELPAARLALARSVVAAEAPCQVSLVRQIGGNLPCVRKGEHAEHQSACGRRWGGEDFTDHPDFDSRAFCDDGSEAP